MAKARNMVIEGKFKNSPIRLQEFTNDVIIHYSFFKTFVLARHTVEDINFLTAAQSKDIGSAFVRGVVGAALIGPVGLITGTLLGKDSSINRFEISYIGGGKSLVEVDKTIGDALYKLMWDLNNNI